MTEIIISSDQKWVDAAATPDGTVVTDATGRFAKVLKSIKQFASVSEVMRVFGAVVMVASMSLFLVQGWTDQNDVQRYLKLLTQTGLLAGAGLLLSLLLKEYRGARMFFGLSLVSIPANFTVIGALILSAFNPAGLTEGLPAFAQWTLAEGMNVGLVTAVALAALLPVTWFAFRIMARRSASKLTMAFILLNAGLMIPVRTGLSLSVVFLLSAAAALLIERRLIRADETLSTPGGVFSRALLFIPALLIYLRSAGFYTFDPILNVAAAAGIYAVSRYFANILTASSPFTVLLRSVQGLAGFATGLLSTQFLPVVSSFPSALIALNAILGLMMIDYQTVRPALLSKMVIAVAAMLISATSILAIVFLPSAIATVTALATGLFLIAYGMTFKQKRFLLMGGGVIATTSFYAVSNITELLMQSGWVGLGMLGGVTIVSASLLDRYGATVKLYFSKFSGKTE